MLPETMQKHTLSSMYRPRNAKNQKPHRESSLLTVVLLLSHASIHAEPKLPLDTIIVERTVLVSILVLSFLVLVVAEQIRIIVGVCSRVVATVERIGDIRAAEAVRTVICRLVRGFVLARLEVLQNGVVVDEHAALVLHFL